MPPRRQKEELRNVLIHEFTHHLESLVGERDLEIEDARELAKYKQRDARKERPQVINLSQRAQR